MLQETSPLSLVGSPIPESAAGSGHGVQDRPTKSPSHPGGSAAPKDLRVVLSKTRSGGVMEANNKVHLLSLSALSHAVAFIRASLFLKVTLFHFS